MSLTLVSVPIGNIEDITLRAIRLLKEAEVIICEEFRPATTLLKQLEIPKPETLLQLNEHSKREDMLEIAELCVQKKVVLISDCGTPGFCDPGQNLIAELRKRNIEVTAAPGPSSLTMALSLAGFAVDRFRLVGFLSAETQERARQITDLKNETLPLVFLDTPYRLNKLLKELSSQMGQLTGTLAMNLTLPEEKVLTATLKILATTEWPKSEFLLLVQAPKAGGLAPR